MKIDCAIVNPINLRNMGAESSVSPAEKRQTGDISIIGQIYCCGALQCQDFHCLLSAASRPQVPAPHLLPESDFFPRETSVGQYLAARIAIFDDETRSHDG
jgi:hypothetical protein